MQRTHTRAVLAVQPMGRAQAGATEKREEEDGAAEKNCDGLASVGHDYVKKQTLGKDFYHHVLRSFSSVDICIFQAGLANMSTLYFAVHFSRKLQKTEKDFSRHPAGDEGRYA